MARYKCTRCNYIYDPANGEPPKIKPGTAFGDLPSNWVCPSCGVSSKRTFKKIEE